MTDQNQKIANLRNLSYKYPAGNSALDKITLSLSKSEIVGLIGSNGSGKTTLLKTLAGYLGISSGYLEIANKPIEEYSEKSLSEIVTLVEQNPEKQLVGPTVEDELSRSCRLMGMRGRDIHDKVADVLKTLKMDSAREWFLDEMSNGERRRVALGLALMGNPKLLLLDEPLSDLDEMGVTATIDILKEARKKGLCVVVTGHKLEDLLKVTDRFAVLLKGRTLIVDTPEAVVRQVELLKKASVQMPAVPAICLELEAQGWIQFEKCPLDVDEAKAAIGRVTV